MANVEGVSGAQGMTGVLDGLLVIDCGSFIAGPAAATLMGDLGARVIKIEAPEGDPHRHTSRLPGMPESGRDYCWDLTGRNKESVVLDLKHSQEREALHRLVGAADVFVTNMPLHLRPGLGIDWPQLEPLNPRLVYASLTGYGETGAEAGRTAFDATAWWGRSGLQAALSGDIPQRSLPGQGDHPTAAALFGAIMLALWRRERTGRGGHVATSLYANGCWSNAIMIQAALSQAVFPPRRAHDDPLTALSAPYRCRDGRWIMLTLVREEKLWPRLVRALGDPALGEDLRFASQSGRLAHAAELMRRLQALLATRDWPDWHDRLRAEDITFGLVANLTEVGGDPQAAAAGIFTCLPDGQRAVAGPIALDGQAGRVTRAAPALGADTERVLAEFGLAGAGRTGGRAS